MDTRTGRLSRTPTSVGLDPSLKDPVRPRWFAGMVEAQLAKRVGVSQFGVNRVTLPPGAYSSLRHWHEKEDEFVLVLVGELTLIDDNGEHVLKAGDYAGFPAGAANAHHLANKSDAPAAFLVVGTRHRGRETLHYPDDFGEPRHVDRDETGARLPR